MLYMIRREGDDAIVILVARLGMLRVAPRHEDFDTFTDTKSLKFKVPLLRLTTKWTTLSRNGYDAKQKKSKVLLSPASSLADA
jgi:hypothetical protein